MRLALKGQTQALHAGRHHTNAYSESDLAAGGKVAKADHEEECVPILSRMSVASGGGGGELSLRGSVK